MTKPLNTDLIHATIRLPKLVKSAINDQAKKENRTFSNYIYEHYIKPIFTGEVIDNRM